MSTQVFKGWTCILCRWQTKKEKDACGGCGHPNSLRQGKIVKTEVYSAKGKLIAQQIESEIQPEPEDTTIAMHEVEDFNFTCFPTEIDALDSVLCGGIYESAAILLAAEAGTGKTRVSLQALNQFVKQKKKCLYLCGEEAASKVKDTAKKLNLKFSAKYFRFSMGTNMEAHLDNIETFNPDIILCDSLDVMKTEDATPGDMAQKKAISSILMSVCHNEGDYATGRTRSCIAISHVNANGEMAGSEANKHLLDVYLKMEKKYGLVEIYCGGKNRFGRADIIEYLEHTDAGLVSVKVADMKSVKKEWKEKLQEEN
jgi:DNA repair protein RadA/Sms